MDYEYAEIYPEISGSHSECSVQCHRIWQPHAGSAASVTGSPAAGRRPHPSAAAENGSECKRSDTGCGKRSKKNAPCQRRTDSRSGGCGKNTDSSRTTGRKHD